MIVTTTPSIEGKSITEYHGIVVGEAIMGANIVRDVFASITDIVGGRSGAYESKLQDARDTLPYGSWRNVRWPRVPMRLSVLIWIMKSWGPMAPC